MSLLNEGEVFVEVFGEIGELIMWDEMWDCGWVIYI